MVLLFTLHHRNKENEPSSLIGTSTAPPRRRRSTELNPYVTRKKVPTKSSIAFSMSQAPPSSMDSSSSLATIEEEETSPTIRRILEKTGCSSRQEFLAMRAAQEANTNGIGQKDLTRNGSKSNTNRNGSKKAATNRSKTAPNGPNATNGAPNVAKTATNPKKKAKSKYFYRYSSFPTYHTGQLQRGSLVGMDLIISKLQKSLI